MLQIFTKTVYEDEHLLKQTK